MSVCGQMNQAEFDSDMRERPSTEDVLSWESNTLARAFDRAEEDERKRRRGRSPYGDVDEEGEE